MKKYQIESILKQEIQWHLDNFDKRTMPEDWASGFIAGIKHCKKLIKEIKFND